CVRPSNALGAGERLGLMGVAGAVVGVALRLGQLRGNMTKSHRMASRASWQEKRCDTMAMPPQIVVRRRHCTWFWDQWDYPQRSYTRPSEAYQMTTALRGGMVKKSQP